jgi:hypothetical protein
MNHRETMRSGGRSPRPNDSGFPEGRLLARALARLAAISPMCRALTDELNPSEPARGKRGSSSAPDLACFRIDGSLRPAVVLTPIGAMAVSRLLTWSCRHS